MRFYMIFINKYEVKVTPLPEQCLLSFWASWTVSPFVLSFLNSVSFRFELPEQCLLSFWASWTASPFVLSFLNSISFRFELPEQCLLSFWASWTVSPFVLSFLNSISFRFELPRDGTVWIGLFWLRTWVEKAWDLVATKYTCGFRKLQEMSQLSETVLCCLILVT